MSANSSQIRILAVDDRALVRDGIAGLAGAVHALDPDKRLNPYQTKVEL